MKRFVFIVAALLLATTPEIQAQGGPDLLGDWALTVTGEEGDSRCGEIEHTGVLKVERQITARAYRGSLRIERSAEKCRGSEASSSDVTLRVKDDVVTLSYDEDGWDDDRLLFKGDTMEGSRGGGITTRWRRLDDTASGGAPTSEQLADLDAFLRQVEPDLTAALNEQYLENLQKNLARTGLTEEEAAQVAEQTISRLGDCMLETIRGSVLAQEIPVRQILEQQNVSVVFNPQAMNMQSNQCIEDASWNAGVRIR